MICSFVTSDKNLRKTAKNARNGNSKKELRLSSHLLPVGSLILYYILTNNKVFWERLTGTQFSIQLSYLFTLLVLIMQIY